MADFDDIDPLDAAFANPKAGKKLKPGEMIPGMGQMTRDEYDTPVAPDAALSKALDEAFSTPKYSAAPEPMHDPHTDDALSRAAEEKLARNLDDAFANPKAGEKIPSQPTLDGINPEQLGPSGYPSDLTLNTDAMAAPKAGMFSPKFLVIGMLLIVVVVGVWVGGTDTTPAKPNVIRLTN